VGVTCDQLAKEVRKLMCIHNACRDSDGSRPVEVHVAHLVRKTLYLVRRHFQVILEHDEASRSGSGLWRSQRGHEEEVREHARCDGVIHDGPSHRGVKAFATCALAIERTLATLPRRDRTGSKETQVDSLLHHNDSEFRLDAQAVECGLVVLDLETNESCELRVAHTVTVHNDVLRERLLFLVVGNKGFVHELRGFGDQLRVWALIRNK